MVIYIILIFIPLLLSFYELLSRKGVHDIVKYLVVAMLVFVTGFRYNGGSDFFNYSEIYNNFYQIDYVEYGFIFICSVLNTIGLGVHAMYLTCSILTIMPFSYILRRFYPRFFCTGISLYLASFIFFESWNTMRQAITMSFTALAVYTYTRMHIRNKIIKREWLAMLFILIAFLFHKSVFFVLPLFCLIIYKNIRPTILMTTILIVSTFVVGHLLSGVYSTLVLLLPHSQINTAYLDEIEMRGVSTGLFQIYLCLCTIAMSIYLKFKEKE